MPPEVVDRLALNRALLARQHLLRRAALPSGDGRSGQVLAMVEQLAGLQAQAPFPPYFGLLLRAVVAAGGIPAGRPRRADP
jgi:hypothetical protein